MSAWHGSPERLSDLITDLQDPFSQAAAVMVSTEAEVQRHQAYYGNAARFEYCPFFLPHLALLPRQPAQSEAAPGNGTVKLLFVGNEATRKGLPLIVAALSKLPVSVQRRASLSVVSNFRDGRVDFRGLFQVMVFSDLPYEGVSRLMSQSDVMLNAASFESYGWVFIEAMAHRLAVMAPDWEVQREIFDGGRAGVLVTPELDSVVHGLSALIDDEALRRRVGDNAHARFRDIYSPDVVAQRFIRILRDAKADG
jgi:glycosyltransferase involved in cell wall biosynthesis